MDYVALRAELLSDPLSRGYSVLSDQAAADSLNAVDRAVERATLSGSAIFNAIVPSEFDALLSPVQARVRDVWGLGDVIDVRSGTNARTVLLAAFGAGTQTRANLAAIVQRNVSRASEIGWGPVGAGDVANARA